MLTFMVSIIEEGCFLPVAKELGETDMIFFVHPKLSTVEMESMTDVVAEIMQKAMV